MTCGSYTGKCASRRSTRPIPIGKTMRIQEPERVVDVSSPHRRSDPVAHIKTRILTRNRTRIKASITLLMALCGTGFSSIGSTFEFHPPLYIASRTPPRISLHRSPALYQQSQVLYTIRTAFADDNDVYRLESGTRSPISVEISHRAYRPPSWPNS